MLSSSVPLSSPLPSSSSSSSTYEYRKARLNVDIPIPYSNDICATLTDYYQITMAYALFKLGRHKDSAVYDVHFRRCPFNGEFLVFAGLNDVIQFVNSLRFHSDQIDYIKSQLPGDVEPEFFEYLESIDGSKLSIYSVREGSVVFPREPLMRVEGPMGCCQLIETVLLNLTNFSSLIATNAARFRLAAGWNKRLLEFGARRAQGPNGAVTASRYSYMGGFDGTSNVRAGHLFDIPVSGTHAHSYVTAFRGLAELKQINLGDKCEDFVSLVLDKKKVIAKAIGADPTLMREGELAAFVAYAQAFPKSFVCLVDTYDTLSSGVPNFLCVALALLECNYTPIGIRLDSGDLAYLSKEARSMFKIISEKAATCLSGLEIIGSNDINEAVLKSLAEQQHEIDSFGIGTNLVTCQKQPALGMVYKLAELNGVPCMKLSQDLGKTSIPSRKSLYRLYGKNGEPLIDVMQKTADPPPVASERMFCTHLFDDKKRCYVVPDTVEEMLVPVWLEGKPIGEIPDLRSARQYCIEQLHKFRSDQLRLINPTPYKVSTSSSFYRFFHNLWQQTAPVFTIG